MRKIIAYVALAIGASGCAPDWEATKERAIADAASQCEREGKEFQLISAGKDVDHKEVIIDGHCLGPKDPGYAPPPK
jgi:hypothetical protein